jgi:hypothetical protein
MEFAPQCCDALRYLDLGTECAIQGTCYDNLRPMGISLWFALPLLVGLDQRCMIYVTVALIVVSISLGSYSLGRLFEKFHPKPQAQSMSLMTVFRWLGAIAIHAIFMLPLWNTSLADPPAGLFALIAVWLLVLSGNGARGSVVLNSAAGLLLGVATWLRVYYLYPQIIVLFVAAVCFLLRPRNRIALLALFIGIVPVAFQYYKTYQHHGYFSYLAKTETEQWTNIHLNDSSVGYDTLLPMAGHRWPTNCKAELGPWQSLINGHLLDAACLYGGKLSFYFGSYASKTYIDHNNEGMLNLPEEIGNIRGWASSNLVFDSNCSTAPDGKVSADRIRIIDPQQEGGARVFVWSNNIASGAYTFSVWLWADAPTSVDMGVFNPNTSQIVTSKTVQLSKQPVRFSVSTDFTKDPAKTVSSLGVIMGKIPGTEAEFGTGNADSFYAWGTKFEQSPVMTEYGKLRNKPIRTWSTALLVANVIVMLITIFIMTRRWRALGVEGQLAGMFVALSLGLSLLIVPEQRFIVVVHIATWMMAFNTVISYIARKLQRT